jgi:hypothetical protein
VQSHESRQRESWLIFDVGQNHEDPEPPEEMREIARSDVAALRATMKKLGITVAEVDCALRYVWIENPHPDFKASAVVGKRDDELIPTAEAVEIMGVKNAVLQQIKPISRVLAFKRSDGWRHYSFRAYPVRSVKGRSDGIVTLGFEASVPHSKTSRRE